jgi:NADPH-dependent 2,4-dienoyl-CoA reductase/sulfur reductase-like enzyme
MSVRRLLVIGGDAGGMGTATQARRLDPDLEIVVAEQGRFTSYSACGIPYVVGGEVASIDDLVVKTPAELRAEHRIDVRIRHRVVALDLDQRQAEIRDLERERTIRLPFDQLAFGTGARPIRPDLPGIDEPWVRGVQNLEDGAALLDHAVRSRCRDVIIVGAGYIGLEMAEAFHRRGARVTLVEAGDHVMGRTLDADLSTRLSDALTELGVRVRLGEQVESFDKGKVVTPNGALPADLVVLGLGVEPNADLAADAGLALGEHGAIQVDRRQQTNVEGVYAAGDCADTFDLIARRRIYIALGTVANRTARVAGMNIGGRYATFPGVVGTAVTKVCSTEVGRTGLTESHAARAGFESVSTTIDSTVRSGYLPGAEPITVKLVAERRTGRLLGGQIVGGPGAAKRIDVLATALYAGLTAADLVDLDLSYAPPFSPVWDPVQAAARQVLGHI